MRALVSFVVLALAACRTPAPAAPVQPATAAAPAQAAVTPAPATPAPPAVAAAPAQPAAAATPAPLTREEEEAAHELVNNNCLGCHTVEMIEQQRITAKQWDATVKKMQGWGVPLEAEEVELMVRYAAQRFGTNHRPYELVRVDAKEAKAAIAPQPDGPFARGSVQQGATLYKEQCAACHGPDGKGAALGVNLVDRTLLYRAKDFAALVRGGRGRMPQFTSSDRQVAALLAYLRTLR
ncbi:MAG TPA: c-type cytochrome [Myxococcaceae bacterium]|nr:c-type cytochrome [Myxococcaceae bacterium]